MPERAWGFTSPLSHLASGLLQLPVRPLPRGGRDGLSGPPVGTKSDGQLMAGGETELGVDAGEVLLDGAGVTFCAIWTQSRRRHLRNTLLARDERVPAS